MSRLYVGGLPFDARERDVEKLFKGYGEIRDIVLLKGFGFVKYHFIILQEFRDKRDAEDAMYRFNGKDFMGKRLVIEQARQSRRNDRDGSRDRYRGDDRDRGYGRDSFRGGDRFRDRDGGRGRDYDRGRGRDRGLVIKILYYLFFDFDLFFLYSMNSGPQRTKYRILVENLSSSVSWQDLKDFMRRAGEVSFSDAHKLRQGEGIVEFADEDGMEAALRKLDGEELKGRRISLRQDRGRSGGFSRNRSRSPYNSRRSRSRSRSPRNNASNSPRRSRSRSPSRLRSTSRPRSHSHSQSRSRSRSRSPLSPDHGSAPAEASWNAENKSEGGAGMEEDGDHNDEKWDGPSRSAQDTYPDDEPAPKSPSPRHD
ncbi:Serine/arginine-rich splicing factor 4 [Smittium mucronatum]|uniref:Serine/arginine-rich splicing factor 4 n=1 Tax=Smittium mucronatum TaxID=133383 RepID=A0A1R0H1A0_9FUNG|nr:Serine/arginine-rich splicing factor 4 [Smittium mucronatum]